MASNADVSSEYESVERLGREYFKKLLQNIKIMLNYVNENGIVVPDDLREKISALFAGGAVIAVDSAANQANEQVLPKGE